ncbi:p150/dynactin-like protein [Trichoderma camerunense]
MPDFKPGQTVLLNDGRKAIVRFAGPTHFQVGEWIGVELEEKTGKNDGSVQGERYFDCPMGYGMFVKPMMATIIAQPAAPKPAAAARKPAARPSGFHPTVGRASISGGDTNLNKRRPSINAPSPSPVPHHKPSQSSSNLRSPSKSPTKQLSGSSSASVSRTGTPSTVRVPSAAGKPRTALPSSRTSMGPPPPPQPGQRSSVRQSSVSSVHSRSGSAPTRPISGRGGITAPKGVSRPESGRRTSTSSQGGRDSSSATRSDELLSSPIEAEEDEILSPQPTSPSAGRANALERIAAESSVPSIAASLKKPAAAGSSRSSIGSTAASREIEDLKAKLKVLERKRVEDRDKLKQLDTIQGERDKFEGIIQKLQQKYQPIQQENTDLRKAIKEAEARFESVEALQAEHDTALELATLDREMAEETSEVLKMEVDALKEKAEELQLELDILKEENAEYSKGMTPEERASTGWLQMERTNERLREALLRLRDLTQEQEQELRDQIASMEEELKEFNTLKEEHTTAKEKLAQSESAVEDLRQQLDTALGAEDMIEDLTERNMSMSEQIEELKAVIEDLENLKEINDELEINHVQNEKEMQEELDFRDSVIAEQARRAQQQDANLGDMEYTLSRFRELVTNLQSDLDDMRASQAVTEGESEKLNDRSRAMMDLNMKLQISASKAQVKTIDLELRRLEAQEAEQHLEILKLFLPDSYRDDQDSVLALLRFRRLAFKANLVNGFIRERVNGQPEPGHEDDVLAGCEAIDKLVWVASMCDRFVNDISHCTIEQFTKYQNSLLELEPVERALNSWIDGLRRDELKEQKCADELQRTISLMSHLGEVHISSGIAAFADDIHMRALIVQSHLDSATVAFNVIRSMVQRAIPAAGEEDELAQHFAKKIDLAITQTRSTKVFAGKAVRALEDLKARSLSLGEDTKGAFEQCETLTQELARLTRDIGLGIHKLLTHDEGRNEPFTYSEVNDVVRQAVLESTQTNESDLFSSYLNKLKVATEQISDLASLAADLDQTHDYDVSPSPWRLRAQELRILKTVPVDTEEELRRLKAEHNEVRRTIAQRDEHLSTAVLKIETLESRMRDAQANVERIGSLQSELEEVNGHVTSLKEDIEKQDRELKNLESERDKWKKIASDSRAYADGADAADMKAGQERAVATAREMDALKKDIESLQAAVRYLRDDNRRARMKEQQDYEWLSEPLKKEPSSEQQRKALVVAEGKDVLGELLKMATSATVFDLSAAPKQKLAWRPARTTPQYHAAKQTEELEAWRTWQESVLKKTDMLFAQDRSISIGREKQQAGTKRDAAARLRIRLPRDAAQGKLTTYSGENVQIVGSQEWDALQAATRKFAAV